MSFFKLKTGQAVPYGIIGKPGTEPRTITYIHAVRIIDTKASDAFSFTADNAGYLIEEWFLCPEKSLTWTKKQINSAGYDNLEGLTLALEKPKIPREITRSERLKQMILSKSRYKPYKAHELIWKFQVRKVEGLGEVLSIIWATKIANEAFDAYTDGKPRQLPLFPD